MKVVISLWLLTIVLKMNVEFPMFCAVPGLVVEQRKAPNKSIKQLSDHDGAKGDEDVDDDDDDDFNVMDFSANDMKVERKENKTPKSIFIEVAMKSA